MQKRILGSDAVDTRVSPGKWFDLEAIADVEVSSEHPDHPIEAALLPGYSQGWRASTPGKQAIRLRFKQAQQIHCVQLDFLESACQRSQEYVLRVSQDDGETFQDIARQQWNFSPEGSTSETELHHVEKSHVTHIELIITPDRQQHQAIASLERLQIA